jgi:hypothetical protein
MMEEDEDNSEEDQFSNSIEGWDNVVQLMELLVNIKYLSISTHDAGKIVQAFDKMSAYDKKTDFLWSSYSFAQMAFWTIKKSR